MRFAASVVMYCALMPGWACADAMSDAAANANAATTVGLGVQNAGDASATVPGYTTTPPQSAYYGTPNLSNQTTLQLNNCAGSSDPSCQAANTGINSAAAPRPPLGPYDTSIASVRDIQNNPTATMGDLSGYYAGCTTNTVSVPGATANKMCARYVGEGNIRCANRLSVSGALGPSCVMGSYLPVTGGDPAEGGAIGKHSNSGPPVFLGVYVRPICMIDSNVVAMRLTAMCQGSASCSASGDTVILVDTTTGKAVSGDTVGLGAVAWAHTGGYTYNYPEVTFNNVSYDGGGCVNNNCTFRFSASYSGTEYVITTAPDGGWIYSWVPYTNGIWSASVSFVAGHTEWIETDTWDDQCALLTAENGFGTCTKVTGPACVEGPSSKDYQGHTTTRACWEYDSTYNCSNGPPTDECTPLAAEGCTQTASSCREKVPGDPLTCGIYEDTYSCPSPPTTTTVTSCPTSSFCVGPDCFNTASPPDQDFARSVTYLEAAREAGRYFDPKSLKVFRGLKSSCDIKLGGLTNCCSGGGGGSTTFTDANVAMNAVGEAGKALFSTYTYDSLMLGNAPDWAINGFEALFGQGLDSGLAGVVAGDLSVSDFLMSMVPGPWTLAMIALQMSGLLDCEQSDQTTAMRKDAHLCHEVGTYCSSDIAGMCLVETHSYCCFNSRLARLINEQGRAQLGMSWGTPITPDCEGFTIDQLQSLDFSKMDLSEFYADIVPTLPNASGVVSNQQAAMPQCYYGQGKCN